MDTCGSVHVVPRAILVVGCVGRGSTSEIPKRKKFMWWTCSRSESRLGLPHLFQAAMSSRWPSSAKYISVMNMNTLAGYPCHVTFKK